MDGVRVLLFIDDFGGRSGDAAVGILGCKGPVYSDSDSDSVGDLVGAFDGREGFGCTGDFDGFFVGNFDGTLVGNFEGNFVGNLNGNFVGNFEGNFVGNFEGNFVGNLDGNFVGGLEGMFVGNFEGNFVGAFEGNLVGDFDGILVGNVEGFPDGLGVAEYIMNSDTLRRNKSVVISIAASIKKSSLTFAMCCTDVLRWIAGISEDETVGL